jgi:hypothetical protein
VDPHTYCRQVIADLLSESRRQDAGLSDRQVVAVLAHFALQKPSGRDFTAQLALLADSAERSHRRSLAAAARTILEDWQRRASVESLNTAERPETSPDSPREAAGGPAR